MQHAPNECPKPSKFMKECQKKTKKKIILFCIFLWILFLSDIRNAFYVKYQMLQNVIRWQKRQFYDILENKPYVIMCHKICQDGYQKIHIDKTNWSRSVLKYWLTQYPKKKTQKTEISLFPLYFCWVFDIFWHIMPRSKKMLLTSIHLRSMTN